MEGGKLLSKQTHPKDSYNIAYIIHFVLGAGNLLPWNALITAIDYFSYLYPTEHIDKVFSVAYMGSSLPVLIALISCSKWSKKPSIRMRMNLGFSLFVFSLLTVPVMDWTYTSRTQRLDGAYSITVAAVAVCGLADGLVGGTLIGSVGELPKRYMQAVFAGTACSGVLVCILRVITKASLPQTPKGVRTSAHLYFVVSALISLGCIACYNILHRLPIIQHLRDNKTRAAVNTTTVQQDPSTDKKSLISANNHSVQEELPTSSTITICKSSKTIIQPKFWDVWKRIRWLAFGVLIIYSVTLSIFPGYITEDVQSEVLRDWYALLLVTLYNIFDLVGKSLTALYVTKSTKKVTLACFARILFYPLFAACLHGPKIFRTEIPVIFLTSGLGLTNGYLTSVLMILAPKSVPAVEAETAGMVMVLFLGIGLVVGSVLGWFWVI